MYIELFLLDNLLMNLLILRIACALGGRPCVPWRVVSLSLLGSLYACAALAYPILRHWTWKLLCAGVLAFALPNGRSAVLYAKAAVCVLIAAFLTGGMFFALTYAFCIDADALPLRWALVGACAAAYLPQLLRRREGAPLQRLCVAYGGQVYALRARVDTGNTLLEPVSGFPVIVAYVPELTAYARIPVPAATVQGKGILYALKPDAVTLDGAPVNALLALSLQPLSCAMLPAAIQPVLGQP